MTRNTSGCLACENGTPKRGRRRCPECGYAFRGSGWDGIDAHWKARHLAVMAYEDFWASLCRDHRRSEPATCPSCRKGIPTSLRQCPECAQVFQGRGWAGIEAHWNSHHQDALPYEEFWRSLCPAHRGDGDGITGYLPLGGR
jgi:predicted amidophosphoribosyltransferase